MSDFLCGKGTSPPTPTVTHQAISFSFRGVAFPCEAR